MALTLAGIRVKLPPGATVSARAGAESGKVSLGVIGDITDLRFPDEQTVEFTLTGSSEAGEFLVDSLRRGRANFQLHLSDRPLPNVKQRVVFGIVWADSVAYETWLAKFGRSSSLGSFDHRPPGGIMGGYTNSKG